MMMNSPYSQRTDTQRDARRAASGRQPPSPVVTESWRATIMRVKHRLRRATSRGIIEAISITDMRSPWQSLSHPDSAAAEQNTPNRREAFGNEGRAATVVCGLFQNVLRSPHDFLRGCLFFSCALFRTCTCRHHDHRLQAAVSSLDSKPVACTGSSLWF